MSTATLGRRALAGVAAVRPERAIGLTSMAGTSRDLTSGDRLSAREGTALAGHGEPGSNLCAGGAHGPGVGDARETGEQEVDADSITEVGGYHDGGHDEEIHAGQEGEQRSGPAPGPAEMTQSSDGAEGEDGQPVDREGRSLNQALIGPWIGGQKYRPQPAQAEL